MLNPNENSGYRIICYYSGKHGNQRYSMKRGIILILLKNNYGEKLLKKNLVIRKSGMYGKSYQRTKFTQIKDLLVVNGFSK